MSNLFRSRIALAVLGIFIIGGGTAAFVAASGRGSSSTSIAKASATATQAPVPTAKASPTATPRPKVIPLNGSVRSVNASSFVIRSNGTHITINVTPQTTYTGSATSLGGITVGMDATIQASLHSDGSYWAISVDTSSGDN